MQIYVGKAAETQIDAYSEPMALGLDSARRPSTGRLHHEKISHEFAPAIL